MEKGNYLLKKYLADRTEENFRSIVREHSSMVQATAARRLNGDLHTAQDVSQQVFLRLARSAPKLTKEINLAGWLYRQSCRISADTIRSEKRRNNRESTAAEFMKNDTHDSSKILLNEIDRALENLSPSDREAIILRHLEGRTHHAVGKHLGVSEEAARKRCDRAIETLRTWFNRNGIEISTSALVAVISGLATPPLPAAT